ncbi:ATP-binding protein [Sphingomonas sp. SUN039]|uniref:sensor histidine kinase n=1 Tax=Sphingomonas sp. SUN039 TaxID=2937787 RepID=UPI002164D86C|nr:ATP-binding protein [Sphingomonas sp. SUN039]UVO53510.1 ATP-binding protein [Sphingomonas sp. SUN039]
MTASPLRQIRIRTALWLRRRRWVPFVEIGTFSLSVAMALITWATLTGTDTQRLLTPPVVAALLLGNLIPAIALLVLIGRRIAKGRAARSIVGGDGRLHVRLVAIFSLVASIPTLLVVVFASLLFQVGVQFWFSDRAKATLEGAASVVQSSYDFEQARIVSNTTTMAGDMARFLTYLPIDSREFLGNFGGQLVQREMSEGMIFHAAPGRDIQALVLLDPRSRDLNKFITPVMLQKLRAGAASVTVPSENGIGALTRLPMGTDNYLYAARFDPSYSEQIQRARAVLTDYRELSARSRSLQLRFNAALLVISLLIVGAAVWIALGVADRLVQPVGALVDAARRVTGGDLSARVAGPHSRDEVGTLATAFNRMTGRLQEQTGDLIAANDQIDRRRALIEAVLSGVSAGVVSIDKTGEVRLTNASAAALLSSADGPLVGQPLAAISPELAELIASGKRESVIELARDGDTRTLAVKVARDDSGHVLTFDDMTQQLSDQRRAAWSDIARRIAHEIKNPLTPIQLAAERLKRRYGAEITSDPGTFTKLTDTIVRQVGDLRRMVDEFSSFARMPKPSFRPESLVDIARQTLFLHEVAHPAIKFRMVAPDIHPDLICDRRQLGQALTNIVKNAVEAVEAVEGQEGGEIVLTITTTPNAVQLSVSDTGIGLPADRERLVEPYVTTRARGTGLGLAIVKKIVEEHFATMRFADRDGGGTVVTIDFDTAALAAMESEPAEAAA